MALIGNRHARQIADNPDLPQLRADGVTLDEVARVLGVSKERVQQIEVQALLKCRFCCFSHGYRIEDLIRCL